MKEYINPNEPSSLGLGLCAVTPAKVAVASFFWCVAGAAAFA